MFGPERKFLCARSDEKIAPPVRRRSLRAGYSAGQAQISAPICYN